MKMAQRSPNPECGRRSGVLARALWALSSVRLGLALFVGVAVYAALGTIPLGPFFEFLGGQAEAPAPTLRYLPWVDLRESEYYSTALFGALLIAIVANMTLATLLRIRWEMKKIGVLVTHAGVIVLAVGALMATHSPLNATMALFADEPTSTGLDRSRTLLRAGADQIGGSKGAQWHVDGVLPRYADFGVPWTDAEGVIELDERWRVTGYAHSARLVPRIEQGTAGMPPGWQVTE